MGSAKPAIPDPADRCDDDEHEWPEFTSWILNGRRVAQSRDGIWRCNGERRRCKRCGLVQDREEIPVTREMGEWEDTVYSEALVLALARDPRAPHAAGASIDLGRLRR